MQAAGLPARLQAPSRLLAALRDSRRFPAVRQASRPAVAVAERSDLRASGGGERDAHRPPAAPPSGADLLRQHLTAAQREHVTHEILQGFLECEPRPSSSANGHRRSGGGSGGGSSHHQNGGGAARRPRPSSSSSGSSSRGGAREAQAAPNGNGGGAQDAGVAARERGLQGRVAEHLLAGGFDEALLEPVPTHTLNWVIKVLGQQQQLVVAEQLFHWMRLKSKANQHSFVKLCEACGACRQPWRAFQAWRVVRRMPQARAIMGGHSGAALVLCYRSTADHRAAIAALADLRQHGVAVDRYAFNAAMRVCADSGAADEALRLLGTLRQLAMEPACGPGINGSSSSASGELRTDCRSYSAAVAAVAAAGRCNRAAQLQRWMREDGLAPDAHLCTQLLSCYATVGQVAAAQQLFDTMLSGDGGIARPNRSHWNVLLGVYAGVRDVAGCAAAYRRMAAAGRRPDCATLVAVLRAAASCGLGLGAVRAVRAEMARHNVQPNNELATAMLCCLRNVAPDPAAPPLRLALDGAGVAAAAAAEQHQQQAGGAADERAACVAEAAALVASLRVAWGQRPRPLDLRVYNALMLCQLAGGDHAGVVATFEALEQEEPGLLPDATTLSAVITACQLAGWADREGQYRRLLASSRLLGALDGGHGGRRSGTPSEGSHTQRSRPRRRRPSHAGPGAAPPAI